MKWLDTQTKEFLQSAPPPKEAPSKSAKYALILLQKGCDEPRMVRAVTCINDIDHSAAKELVSQTPPIVIHRDLRYEDAVLGQFELICCDAPAAVLNAEVLDHGGREYLESLFLRILQSAEFQPCHVVVLQIPRTQAGEKFVDQFLGFTAAEWRELILPLHLQIPYKKARIMKHWAQRIGVVMGFARHPDEEGTESLDDHPPIGRPQ